MSDGSEQENIFLIGSSSSEFTGSNLPTNMQVMRVLFHKIRHLSLSLDESVRLVVEDVVRLWDQHCSLTQDKRRCRSKLHKLYLDWRSVQKHKGEAANKDKEKTFSEKLNSLFDISHGSSGQELTDLACDSVENPIPIEQMHSTANAQCRIFPSDIEGVQVIGNKQFRSVGIQTDDYCEELIEKFSQLSGAESNIGTENQSSQSESDTNTTWSQKSKRIDYTAKGRYYECQNQRGTKNIMTRRLAMALDNIRISYRDTVHLISAVADALECDISNAIINTTSFYEMRNSIREEVSENIKELFGRTVPTALVIRWDTEIIQDSHTGEKRERLAIVASDALASHDIDHFISSASMSFFERFNLSTSFLRVPCEPWTQDESYKENLKLVRKIGVVNDAAERAVKLGQDYLNVLTKDEKQKQYLIQVVPEYRNEFPDATRQTLMKKRRLE
ncbi:hypothetical protein QAD02_018878 [Eretmocerus hayati]|uniref:Uncharacterized protein n=2 Tax=Eretmocerus hayati TaxID=131215 RepID=A0ACC2PMR4_9HYME|nr:hypothetical protein QAD02_018877 [Eretmocerus hayati]KAJ8683086.1 hypothetical protein QAD02_018878 [Eretmocerus hayati]